MYLNCCGIKPRLQYPEFQNLIKKHDIVCFVETRTDEIDMLHFPGYSFHMKNRKKITNKRSGGIVIGFKTALENDVEIVNTESRYVHWFKCSENLFKTDQPIFFGVVYIPPENTRYSSDDAFSELEQEYLSFCTTSNLCLSCWRF